MSAPKTQASLNKAQVARTLHMLARERHFLNEAVPTSLWVIHADGRTEFCNDYWERYTGLSCAESANGGWISVAHPEDIEPFRARWAAADATKQHFDAQVRLRRACDGQYRRHLCRATPKFNRHRQFVCWIGSCTDIEDQRHLATLSFPNDMRQNYVSPDEIPHQQEISQEQETECAQAKRVNEVLHESEKRHRKMIDNVPGMVYQFELSPDSTMRFIFVSAGSRTLFGLEPEAIENDAMLMLAQIAPEHQAAFYDSVADSARNLSRWIWEGWSVTSGGERKWISCSSVPTPYPDGRLVWDGLLMDATEQKLAQLQVEIQNVELAEAQRRLSEMNQKLDALATLDGLTGLKNRRRFQEHVIEEFQRHTRFDAAISLMMIDVDKFKLFNDSFGHLAGDEVLKKVAHILKSSMREVDFVARYGGEEFIVLLPRTSKMAALMLGERVRCSIESQSWNERPITISVGVTTISKINGHTPEQMIEAADKALYESKKHGRNRVTYNHSFDDED
jgi:diguanylate cyclase (GGDEF)-like protein/PAS domain S-box-containing protein